VSEKHVKHYLNRLQQLRNEAEARLALDPTEASVPPTSSVPLTVSAAHTLDALLHELQVHQIELQMQNEELQQACATLEASRDRYVNLYEFAPIGYFTLTTEGLIAEINLKAASMLGIERNSFTQWRFVQFVADQDKDHWYSLFQRMKRDVGKREQCLDLILIRKDGSTFNAHLECQRTDNIGESQILHIILADITQFKQAEAELRITATVFESEEGMFITDANWLILKVNQAFTAITGYTAGEVIGQTPRLLKSGRHDAAFYAGIWGRISSTGAWHGEIWDQRKNGEVYPQWLTITAVQGGGNVALYYVATMIDITHQKAASERIEQLAFYDPLTNLPNRRLLLDRLKQALASTTRSDRKGALLFIDLDNFKTLNDTLGHDIGDLLLLQVAQRLVTCVREGDTVARLGGDEFVVMLEDLSENPEEAANQTKIAAEKMLATLNKPYLLAVHDYRCTSSIGIILFGGQSVTVNDLLKRVDIAMYQAKHDGRNTLCFFDQEMQARINAHARLERDLRRALTESQFKLYYQKQVTHDGKVIGAEVLIHWQHPERGLILPTEFIPLSEETGLILPIGQWVLEAVCTQLKKWECNPLTQHLQLAVNVSARQFYQADFVEQVLAVLTKSAIDPSKLMLELTKNLVLDDINDTILKMNALREVGVKFSMDDFGTGYSSLTYLAELPLTQLKIDQSFVHNIGIKLSDAIVVQTIIGIANNLGVSVIAEGVETEEQRLFLEQHDCPFFQGYLFGKPVPLEEFERLISPH